MSTVTRALLLVFLLGTGCSPGMLEGDDQNDGVQVITRDHVTTPDNDTAFARTGGKGHSGGGGTSTRLVVAQVVPTSPTRATVTLSGSWDYAWDVILDDQNATGYDYYYGPYLQQDYGKPMTMVFTSLTPGGRYAAYVRYADSSTQTAVSFTMPTVTGETTAPTVSAFFQVADSDPSSSWFGVYAGDDSGIAKLDYTWADGTPAITVYPSPVPHPLHTVPHDELGRERFDVGLCGSGPFDTWFGVTVTDLAGNSTHTEGPVSLL